MLNHEAPKLPQRKLKIEGFSTIRLSIFAVFALLFSITLPRLSLAQSIALSGPSNLELPDAEDFFTDVWGQGKNFNDTCDIGFDGWHFEPETISAGIWNGTHPEIGQPIVGIMPVPTLGSQLAYRENCGRLGAHLPLNADKYSLLSFRNSTSNPSQYAVLWSLDNSFAFLGSEFFDGFQLTGLNTFFPNSPNTLSIKTNDLKASAPLDHPWAGEVRGLSLFTTLIQPAGGSIAYDWFRIIDPNTSPSINLSWSTTGELPNSTGNNVVIYVDQNSSGYDGDIIQRGLITGSGDFSIKSGILPPGSYYFYAQLENDSFEGPSTISQSNYIGPIVINGKPTIKFKSPSRMGGEEYANSERGDPWDMSSFSDLVNVFNPDGSLQDSLFRGFHDPKIENGTFQAKTDFDRDLGTVDTQVHFSVPTDKPIDPNKYRYFCYSMQVDPVELVRDGDPVELNRAGWVARLVWLNRSNGQLGSTKAHELIERSQTFPDYENGFVDFCIDLWDPESFESGIPWTQMESIDLVRFDPLEAGDITPFAIDWAGLYAENITSEDRSYQITFELNDPESQTMEVEFFYDTDREGFNGVSIGSIEGLSNGASSFQWNAEEVPEGDYYIYAVIRDGVNTSYFYSDVEVEVRAIALPPAPEIAPRAPCDFDGDLKTDIAVVRGGGDFQEAHWFIRNSSIDSVSSFPYGFANLDIFIGADLNGDQLTDPLIFRGRVDPFTSFVANLSGLEEQRVQGWGVLGDVPIVTDLDGDSVDDPTVFRPSSGEFWSIRSAEGAIGLSWGLNGDIPVPSDFDGDNRDDLAVWRPSDGFWWILQSSKNNSTAPEDVLYRQFGLPGDSPMVGDYTGDGVSDLVVYRPSSGHWFVCPSQTNFDCLNSLQVTQFGLPGDFPIRGDFDGDGTLDLAVYRPAGGYWFYQQSSDAQIRVIQHGGFPNDWPLCTGSREVMQNLGYLIP